MQRPWLRGVMLPLVFLAAGPGGVTGGEAWPQFKFDARHSGNAPDRDLATPLGLVAAAPLTDAVLAAPVVAEGRVYVVDGSGVAFCLDARTLAVRWKLPTGGGGLRGEGRSAVGGVARSGDRPQRHAAARPFAIGPTATTSPRRRWPAVICTSVRRPGCIM